MENQTNGQMSINDLILAAEEAHKNGVPVDWRQVAYTVVNVANNYIANLEEGSDERDSTI